jgi:organic hydroperoxide reductase OsmC/OhrA
MSKEHRYGATIAWERGAQAFTDRRYSRAHEWRFDGGAVVAASSSPAIVPLPMSDAAAVDPEEALVAATSSCHMLFFLDLASRAGFTVDRYLDAACGTMAANELGKLAMTRIALRPRVTFAGAAPDAQALADLHERAHAACFIANSLRAEVVVEPAGD